jgi:predicted nucleic acid-binding protein
MKISLYLETSTIGAYLDNADTFRRDLTIRWFEHELHEYDVFSSDLVVRELQRISEPHRSSYLGLVDHLPKLEITEEAAILAEAYIERAIISRKFIADAVHLAVASYHKVDYFVTWNFGHMANVRKAARLKMFNLSAGFSSPTIVTPEFLVHVV